MDPEHQARITWSAAQIHQGLPSFEQTTDPAWFADDPPGADGWSLVCRFAPTPQAEASPSLAQVAFMMPHAPHQRLAPGTRLHLFERASGGRALVEILD